MTSYLSQAEIDALQTSGLHRKTPYLVRGVTQTMFSVARFYGAATIQGDRFTYLDETDELIRDDVKAFVEKLRKPKRTRPRKAERQAGLFEP